MIGLSLPVRRLLEYIFFNTDSMLWHTIVKGAILYQSTAAAIFSKIGRQKS